MKTLRSKSFPLPQPLLDNAVYDALAVGDADVPANKAQLRFLRNLSEAALYLAAAEASGTEPVRREYDAAAEAEALRRAAGGAAPAPCADPRHAELLESVLAGGEAHPGDFARSDFIRALCGRVLEPYEMAGGDAVADMVRRFIARRLPDSDRLAAIDEYGDPACLLKVGEVTLEAGLVRLGSHLLEFDRVREVREEGGTLSLRALGNDLPYGAGSVFDSYRELPLSIMFLKEVP